MSKIYFNYGEKKKILDNYLEKKFTIKIKKIYNKTRKIIKFYFIKDLAEIINDYLTDIINVTIEPEILDNCKDARDNTVIQFHFYIKIKGYVWLRKIIFNMSYCIKSFGDTNYS